MAWSNIKNQPAPKDQPKAAPVQESREEAEKKKKKVKCRTRKKR
jgi:hypothetical protein